MRALFAVVICLIVTNSASAQTAEWRFQWQPGQILNYRVEHSTTVTEVVGGNNVQTKSKVNLVKRWEVEAVDPQGAATVRMSITSMRNEQTRPSGDVVLFDSQTPEKSAPELRDQLSKFIGQTVAVLRIDRQGRVIQVKQGQASRYEAEPPFALLLPAGTAQAGQSWDRNYTISLDPPFGTGAKLPAQQKHVCPKIDGSVATITFTTILGKTAENKLEEVALAQRMPQGDIEFDLQRGRLRTVRMVIDRQVQGHQGEGSSYRFQSSYSEQYVE